MRKRAAFYSQLARMLQAGIGVGRCLATLAGQGGSYRLARAAQAMARHVAAGNPLAEAFAHHPNIFLANEVRVIEGASRAGREPDAMLAIARLLDRLATARTRVVAGMIYPVACLGVAFIVLPLVLAYFTGMFGGVGHVLRVQFCVLGIAAGVWLGLLVAFRSIPEGSRTRVGVHAFALGLPLFGKILRRLAMARFADTFHSLYVAGVMMPEALARAATACGNAYIGSRILGVVPEVTRGGSVAAALAQSGVIPVMGVNLIETGEVAGKLEDQLQRFAEYQSEDLEVGIERMTKILPTAALFLMIIILAYAVLAAYGAYISGAMNLVNQ
ncbi:MAG TPA: type II secretion system F family protein [Planctomycetota bacterium]|nr:type II secretion system F family protein [Planctomycetota bacterium]